MPAGPVPFERATPNELWQLDHKGPIEVARQRIWPLSIVDDYSRYCLCFKRATDVGMLTTWELLWGLFEQYGLPDSLLCDNAFSAPVGLSWFDARLVRLDIKPIHGRPYHPQTQGKVEGFNGTVERELLSFKENPREAGQIDNWYTPYRQGWFGLMETLVHFEKWDEILDGRVLPIGYVAYTPCFRREAFSHGKDTRGLIRVHQFDKVELVRLAHPEQSCGEHELLTGHAEAVLRRLGLPYRVVELAAGDTGFSAARTFDLEVWAPGVGAWLEVSSSSTFTDFQARRLNLRFRPAPGAKPELVHTLNASGVAFPRTLIGLLEHYQEADSSVRLPEALLPYVGTDRLAPG